MGDDRESPVFLVGFMGAGKTTLGKMVARLLKYRFVDLDELIEARMGMSVSAIFGELGEAEFRRLESEAIETCREMSKTVVALGGGAYIGERNRAVLREIGKTVWLDCPLEVCLARLGEDPSRPVLGGEAEMRELLDRRLPAYRLADYTVETGSGTPDELAKEVAILVREKD